MSILRLGCYACCFSLLTLWSCRDDEETIPTEVFYLDSQRDVHAVEVLPFTNYHQFIAATGSVWNSGGYAVYPYYSDIPRPNIEELISDEGIFDLVSLDKGFLACGTGGKLYFKEKIWSFQWQTIQLGAWGLLKGLTRMESKFLAVGGKSLKEGYIYHISKRFGLSAVKLIDQELTAVAWHPKRRVAVASGFGGIWYSRGGSVDNWEVADLDGDFYTDIECNMDYCIVVGVDGQIARSYNGVTWQKVKDADAKWEGINYDEAAGLWIVVGDEGKLAWSFNNGSTWEEGRLDVDTHLQAVASIGGQAMAVGKGGAFCEFEIPR